MHDIVHAPGRVGMEERNVQGRRRIWPIAGLAAIAVVAGTGAGLAQSDPASSGGAAPAFDWQRFSGTRITFLADQAPWTDGLNTIVGEFTAQTGIEVDVQAFPEDLYMDKQEQVVRAPTGTADAYFLSMDSIAFSQWNANAIEPLDRYLEDPSMTSPDYDLADFPANFLIPATYPPGDPAAQLYGIPISFETYILFYNEDLVDRFLDGKVPETMDELTAAAARITQEGAGEGIVGSVVRGVRSGLVVPELEGLVANRWGAAETPQPYNIWYDGAWDKPRLTDPAICQGITDWARLVAAGPPNRFSLDWPDAVTVFSQGKAAFYIDASLFSPTFENPDTSLVAGRVGYTTLPPPTAGGPSHTTYWEWGIGIPANAPNKDAAWYFVQWVTNKQNTARIGAFTGGAPRLSAYEDPAYTASLDPESRQSYRRPRRNAAD